MLAEECFFCGETEREGDLLKRRRILSRGEGRGERESGMKERVRERGLRKGRIRQTALVFKAAAAPSSLSLKREKPSCNRLAFDGPADSWGNRLRALTARCFALSHSVFLARSLGQWWFGFTFVHIVTRGNLSCFKAHSRSLTPRAS
ncbi:hypothetical protein CEXT_141801 [Caerostris extrusa]|uniref:Uncharacterized protein n=1 Tax=Caerostris extrusa TaxID=172846 RepID=A0AAV4XDZ3_CAEEX|nr:hypothetical protein CEXT_141801 [Caerostris extrusa]